MWLHGERNLIVESHPQIIKYWCFGLAVRVGWQLKASVFDNLGMRLHNQLCFSRKSHFVTFKFADFSWVYHLGVTDESCSSSFINRQSNEMRFNRLERVSTNAFWCYLKLEAAPHCFYYPITVHQANDVFISSDPYWFAVWPLSGPFVYFHFLFADFGFLCIAVWLFNRQIWCWDCNRAVFEQMLSSRLLKYFQQSSITKVRSFPLMSSVVSLVPLQSNIKGPLCASCFKLWVRQLLTTQVAPLTNTHPCTIYFPYVYTLCVCMYVCTASGDPDRAGEAEEQLQTGCERRVSG